MENSISLKRFSYSNIAKPGLTVGGPGLLVDPKQSIVVKFLCTIFKKEPPAFAAPVGPIVQKVDSEQLGPNFIE
jgi:hypothetical protein